MLQDLLKLEINADLLLDLQQHLQTASRTNPALANLSSELARSLELCGTLTAIFQNPSGTPASESSPSAMTASDWRTPGPKDTRDTLTKKLNHALTELQISREPQPASGSQDSIPSLAEAVRIVDRLNRPSRSEELDTKRKAWGLKPISSVNRKLRRKHKT